MKTKIDTKAGRGSLDCFVRPIITDTPETDAHLKACLWSGGRNGNAYELCRKLERDRGAWRDASTKQSECLSVALGWNNGELTIEFMRKITNAIQAHNELISANVRNERPLPAKEDA